MSDGKSFDWYLSPSDRFQYESQFHRLEQNGCGYVILKDLDPVFNQSRLDSHEFLQLWHLMDLRLEEKLEQVQFVYFMHCVASRRRGSVIPVGLPLHIKEEILSKKVGSPTSKIYVRPNTNVRDVGASSKKSLKELKKELQDMETLLKTTLSEQTLTRDKLSILERAKAEIEELAAFSKDAVQSARAEFGIGDGDSLSGVNMQDEIGIEEVREYLSSLERDGMELQRLSREAASLVNS